MAVSIKSQLNTFSVDSALLDNGKLIILSEALGLRASGYAHALLLLIATWSWVAKNAPTGEMTCVQCARLGAHLRGRVCPPVADGVDLLDCLCRTGFIDLCEDKDKCEYKVHDWVSYQKPVAQRIRQKRHARQVSVSGASGVRQHRVSTFANEPTATSNVRPEQQIPDSPSQEKGSHTLLKEVILESNLDSKEDSKDSPPISPPQKSGKKQGRTKTSKPVETSKPARIKLRPSEAPYSQLLLSPHLLELCNRELRDTTTVYRELDQYLAAAFTEEYYAKMGKVYPSIDIRRVAVKLLKYNIEQSVKWLKYKDFQGALSDWMRSSNDRGYPVLKGGYTHVVPAPKGSAVNLEFGAPQPKQECLEGV